MNVLCLIDNYLLKNNLNREDETIHLDKIFWSRKEVKYTTINF